LPGFFFDLVFFLAAADDFFFFFAARCCGGLLATTSAARSKRAHASECSSTSFEGCLVMPIQSHDPHDHMSMEAQYCDPFGIPMPDGHYAHFGRFLLACARIESTAHQVIRPMIPIGQEMARMLIGQPRLEDLLNLIGKLCVNLGHTEFEIKAFRDVKTHASYIYRVRNIIAHQEPAWREGWLRYDRYSTAKDISKREDLLYIVRLDELDNLTEFAKLIVHPLNDLTLGWYQNRWFNPSSLEKLRTFLDKHELPADPDKLRQRP
jgi:hypothetical protein